MAEDSGMPKFVISASSVTSAIWGRFLDHEEIKQSLALLFHIAVSTISEQSATARASGDKAPSQEHPMYNREQPESARVSQEETSSQEYQAESHSKFFLKNLFIVSKGVISWQYLCVVLYWCYDQRTHALVDYYLHPTSQ